MLACKHGHTVMNHADKTTIDRDARSSVCLRESPNILIRCRRDPYRTQKLLVYTSRRPSGCFGIWKPIHPRPDMQDGTSGSVGY